MNTLSADILRQEREDRTNADLEAQRQVTERFTPGVHVRMKLADVLEEEAAKGYVPEAEHYLRKAAKYIRKLEAENAELRRQAEADAYERRA